MPVIQHPVFVSPGVEQRIWRYLSVGKYLDMLRTRSLFFCRTDRLEDQFEGSLPRPNVAARHEKLEPIRANAATFQRAAKELGGLEWSLEEARKVAESGASFVEQHMVGENFLYRRFTFVNCWHMNEGESAAMWQVHARSPESVAIESTVGRLVDALATTSDKVYVGAVRYTNYESQLIPDGNLLERFMTKRKSFEHESELRALMAEFPPLAVRPDGTKFTDLNADPGVAGRAVAVDVDRLVARVVVAPPSPNWLLELIAELTRYYGHGVPVHPSALTSQPSF